MSCPSATTLLGLQASTRKQRFPTFVPASGKWRVNLCCAGEEKADMVGRPFGSCGHSTRYGALSGRVCPGRSEMAKQVGKSSRRGQKGGAVHFISCNFASSDADPQGKGTEICRQACIPILLKNPLFTLRPAQGERRGFKIIDVFPFVLRFSKHERSFSAESNPFHVPCS